MRGPTSKGREREERENGGEWKEEKKGGKGGWCPQMTFLHDAPAPT